LVCGNREAGVDEKLQMSRIDVRESDVADFPLILQCAKVIEVMNVCIISVIPSMVFDLVC